MPEYIYEIEEEQSDESEIFIGWIKRHSEQLIRCKDCKYFTRDTITGVTIPGSEYCIFTMNNRIEEDDFCSRAERKEK